MREKHFFVGLTFPSGFSNLDVLTGLGPTGCRLGGPANMARCLGRRGRRVAAPAASLLQDRVLAPPGGADGRGNRAAAVVAFLRAVGDALEVLAVDVGRAEPWKDARRRLHARPRLRSTEELKLNCCSLLCCNVSVRSRRRRRRRRRHRHRRGRRGVLSLRCCRRIRSASPGGGGGKVDPGGAG